MKYEKKEWISSGLMGQIAKGQTFKNPLWFSCALWLYVDWYGLYGAITHSIYNCTSIAGVVWVW